MKKTVIGVGTIGFRIANEFREWSKYYTVLWNNGQRARVRKKEVKVISECQ